MKQTHVLAAVCAFVSVLTSAQVAVAGEQGLDQQQREPVLEIAASAQPVPPAEWRTDRYLAMPSMAGVEGQEARGQASGEPMIPAEWRTERYLAEPSMAGVEGQEAQGKASGELMIPAEWRDDRFQASGPMADAGNQQVSTGSC